MTIVILMGVTGAGKSTVGRYLSQELGWSFIEGDDYHPPANIQKMAQGQPLDDADRIEWLDQLAMLIGQLSDQDQPAVMTCSTLKRSYRSQLRAAGRGVHFVYLRGERDLLWQRLSDRQNHFMPASLLDSQFATLEEPRRALTINVDQPVTTIVKEIQRWLFNVGNGNDDANGE